MLSFRLTGTPGFRLFAIFWVWVLFLPHAHAQTGAFFERDKLSEKQYSLTIDSIFSTLNRTNFSSPTFLLGEDLQKLELLSFTTEIKAQIDLFEGIAIQVEAPLIVREVGGESFELQICLLERKQSKQCLLGAERVIFLRVTQQ